MAGLEAATQSIVWHHSDTFGFHHLNHQSHLKVGPFQELYYSTNLECLDSLDQYGVPPALPEWDSWWSPTYDNITHIQTLTHQEEEDHGKHCFQDFEWLQVGMPVIFWDLTSPTLLQGLLPPTMASYVPVSIGPPKAHVNLS